MTSALEESEWSAARPGRSLPPGKTRYPFYIRLGGPQGRSGRAENLVPTGVESRTAQPVAQLVYRLSYRAHYTLLWAYFNFYAYSVHLILDVDKIVCKIPRTILLMVYNFHGN